MQNVLLPGAAIVLALVLWLRGRSGRPMLRSTDASGVAELNRSQLSLVHDSAEFKDLNDDHAPEEINSWRPPATERDRLDLYNQLRRSMEGAPEERLEAVRIAALWRTASVLPLLRRALRDSDSRVMAAAAAAIAPRRGAPRRLDVQAPPLPRNVARTR